MLFGEAVSLWRQIARGDMSTRPAAVPALLLARASASAGHGVQVMPEALTLLRQLAGEAQRDASREAARVAA